MPHYEYECEKCEIVYEIWHSMKEKKKYFCEECSDQLNKLISGGAYIIGGGINGTIQDHKEREHTKKVKDPERAVKMRKKAFGQDAVGDPSMQTDPRHVIKKGRTLGGAQKEVDKKEFVKALAKDDYAVNKAKEVLKKKDKK